MRTFWYISKAKVDSLASQQETVLERLRATLSALVKAEVKVPVGSIGVELKSNNPEPSLSLSNFSREWRISSKQQIW